MMDLIWHGKRQGWEFNDRAVDAYQCRSTLFAKNNGYIVRITG